MTFCVLSTLVRTWDGQMCIGGGDGRHPREDGAAGVGVPEFRDVSETESTRLRSFCWRRRLRKKEEATQGARRKQR